MLPRFQFAVLLLLNLTAVAALGVNNRTSNYYDGVYQIARLWEGAAPNRQEVVLPLEESLLVRFHATNNNETDYYYQPYRIVFNLGNRLMGDASISESPLLAGGRDAFALDGPMVSTRMMPPPEIYAVEQVVLRVVPAFERIYFDKDDKLVLQGPTGLMRCTKSSLDE